MFSLVIFFIKHSKREVLKIPLYEWEKMLWPDFFPETRHQFVNYLRF